MKQIHELQLEQDNANQRAADISGYKVFSGGEWGEAHTIAHRMFDCGDLESGHRLLGEWLEQHTGKGSQWIHLQFHMALFELELGNWQSAYTRFWKEVLPTAATSDEALTDAPALLWRLQMTAAKGVVLPWQPLRRTALSSISCSNSTFVQIHNLLALTGAGDVQSIKQWMTGNQETEHTNARNQWLVQRFARTCIAIASESFQRASEQFQALQPGLAKLGGSHAQLQLFTQLAQWAERQVQNSTRVEDYLYVA